MKQLITAFLSCMVHFFSIAQVDTLEIHYFSDSTISTIQTISDGWGEAIAYNRTGKIIYKNGIRRVAGTASVKFSYHKNDVIKKAEYYSAPDGGIQWQRVVTYFDENGVQVRENKDGHDRMQQLLTTDSEVATCAAIHQNEVYVKNDTRKKVKVTVVDTDTNYVFIAPGDSKLIKRYISAEITQPPSHFMKIYFSRKRRWSLFDSKRNDLKASLKKELSDRSKTCYTYTVVRL